MVETVGTVGIAEYLTAECVSADVVNPIGGGCIVGGAAALGGKNGYAEGCVETGADMGSTEGAVDRADIGGYTNGGAENSPD